MIYQATGKTPADIQPVVDQFRRDISKGGGNNGDLPGPLPNGRREISGDDLAGKSAFPTPNLDISVRGTRWATPGTGNFLLSVGPSRPDDPDRNFGNINPSYVTTFQPFESTRLIGVDGRFNWAMGFGFPGSEFRLDQHVGISALGIIFTDVDVDHTAGIHIADGDLGTYFASAAVGDGNLSFLGLRFEDGTLFNSASIFGGNFELSAFNMDGECRGLPLGRPGSRPCGLTTDVVAISKIIFAEPVPEPSGIGLILLGLTFLVALRLRVGR